MDTCSTIQVSEACLGCTPVLPQHSPREKSQLDRAHSVFRAAQRVDGWAWIIDVGVEYDTLSKPVTQTDESTSSRWLLGLLETLSSRSVSVAAGRTRRDKWEKRGIGGIGEAAGETWERRNSGEGGTLGCTGTPE